MPGEKLSKPLRPLKIVTHGRVQDSGATPLMKHPRSLPIDWKALGLDT
jgi:hypothetical protein